MCWSFSLIHLEVGFCKLCELYPSPSCDCMYHQLYLHPGIEWHDAHIEQLLRVTGILCKMHCTRYVMPNTLQLYQVHFCRFFVPSPWQSGMTRILGRRLTEASSRHGAMFSLLATDRNPSQKKKKKKRRKKTETHPANSSHFPSTLLHIVYFWFSVWGQISTC